MPVFHMIVIHIVFYSAAAIALPDSLLRSSCALFAGIYGVMSAFIAALISGGRLPQAWMISTTVRMSFVGTCGGVDTGIFLLEQWLEQ